MIPPPENERSWIEFGFAAIILPLLFISFFCIEHQWTASEYVSFMTFTYDGTENVTADKLDGLVRGSIAGRLVLAAFGFLGLILPARYKMNWSSPTLWCWLMYWSVLFVSMLWSVEPSLTGFKLVVLVVFAVAAFGLPKHFSVDNWNLIIATTCCCYIVFGIFAEFVLGTFAPTVPGYRFTGTAHPNTQAVYGIVACLVGCLYFGKSRRLSIYSLVFLALGCGCVVFTKSRTSLFALILGISAIMALRMRGTRRVLLVSGAVGGLILGIFVVSLLGARAMGKVGNVAAMGRADEISTLTGRIPLWEELMEKIADRPVLGYGYLGFWDADRVEYLSETLNWEIPHGHNMYVDILLDGGIIGLTFFMFLILAVVLGSLNAYSKQHVHGAALLFGLVIAALVHGMGESLFKIPGFPGFILYSLVFRSMWIEEATDEIEEPVGVELAADQSYGSSLAGT